jgi:hypothetical protein
VIRENQKYGNNSNAYECFLPQNVPDIRKLVKDKRRQAAFARHNRVNIDENNIWSPKLF